MEMRGAFTLAIVPAFGEGGGGEGGWKYQGFVLLVFRQKRQCNENLADCEVGGDCISFTS